MIETYKMAEIIELPSGEAKRRQEVGVGFTFTLTGDLPCRDEVMQEVNGLAQGGAEDLEGFEEQTSLNCGESYRS